MCAGTSTLPASTTCTRSAAIVIESDFFCVNPPMMNMYGIAGSAAPATSAAIAASTCRGASPRFGSSFRFTGSVRFSDFTPHAPFPTTAIDNKNSRMISSAASPSGRVR